MRHAILFAAATFIASSAWATAQRTFVSHNGLDTNPCSVDSPCRSFATAISQTNANGEVVAVDSAGYGPVTVTQSATVVAPLGVHAGISVFNNDGITVNAASTDTIVLRNLYINNVQNGQNGITVSSGSTVHVEHCVVSGFVNNNINIDAPDPAAQPVVVISDTVSRGAQTAGVFCNAGLRALVSIQRCLIELNLYGVLANSATVGIADSNVTKCNAAFVAAPVGSPALAIESCMVTACNLALEVASGSAAVHNTTALGSGNAYQIDPGGKLSLDHCVVTHGTSGVVSFGDVSVAACTIADNSSDGIHVGVGGIVRLTGNTIIRNNTGINNAGGTVNSTGDNMVDGNNVNTSGTILAANKA